MGLDMTAGTVNLNDVLSWDGEVVLKKGAKVKELHYWRKHHDLHGWMERLYRSRGGKAESFNCIAIRLTEADLDALEADIKAYALPETTGFFFGNNPPDEETVKEDLEFIADARRAIKKGLVVLYDSWW